MSNSYRIIGAAIGLALSVPALSRAEPSFPWQRDTGPKTQNGDASTDQAKSDKRVTNMCGSSFTLNCAGQEGSPDKHEERRNTREELDLVAQRDAADAASHSAWWAKWQFWASALGLIGLGFTFWETRRTASAAINANKLSEDTAKRQLRAYVLVESVVASKDPRSKDGFGAVVTTKNFGMTPAKDLSEWVEITVADLPLTISLPPHKPNNPSRSIVGPGVSTIQIPTMKKLPDDIESAVLENRAAIYVYGEVQYADAFGERRTTKYRLMSSGQGHVLGLYRACSEGNEYT
jgi:hypothetical protein